MMASLDEKLQYIDREILTEKWLGEVSGPLPPWLA
jgi:hypothetical protein